MTKTISPLDDLTILRHVPETMAQFRVAENLSNAGRYAEAIEIFEELLAAHPNSPQIIFRVAKLAVELEMFEEAERFYQILNQMMPGDPSIASNQGILLRRLDRHDEAIEVYRAAIQSYPTEAQLWLNLGTVVNDMGDVNNAQTFYREAVRLQPKNRSARANLALTYLQTGQFELACKEYSKLRSFLKTSPYHRYNYAIALFHCGDIKKAWENYEGRQDPSVKNAIVFHHDIPQWQGEDLKDKKILVSAEQGLGDQVMFLNTLPDLIESAAEVWLEIEPRIARMVQRSYPDATVVPYQGRFQFGQLNLTYNWLPEQQSFDYWTPSGSTFRFLRTGLDEFPSAGSYLTPDPELVEKWQTRLAPLGKEPRVGLFRRSGLLTAVRKFGYPAWDHWNPVFANKDRLYFDLHYDDSSEERSQVSEHFGIDLHYFDDLDYMNDLENALALTACMDAVISPPSSVQWFASAIGVPVVGVTMGPLWTLFNQDYSPMQPSSRVVQAHIDPDRPLGDKIADALEEILAQRH